MAPKLELNDVKRILRAHDGALTPIEIIGAGSFGVCALAYNSQGVYVAVKIQRRSDSVRESKALATYAHKRVIGVRSVVLDGVEKGLSILCLEYAAIGNLYRLAARFDRNHHRMPEALLWQVLKDLAEALMYLHHGIMEPGHGPSKHWRGPAIHGDIKPENILLRAPDTDNQYPRAVLGDFGFAERLPPRGVLPPRGTLGYVAPENEAGTKSDVYALGQTMYVCALGGREPQEGDATVRLTTLGYTPEFERTVFGALEADPRRRSSARGVHAACLTYGVAFFRKYFKPLRSWAYPSDYQR